MSNDADTAHPALRCTFFALRGADLLFKRSLDLVGVPRVGERVQMWFSDDANIRGTVRDVRWTIPKTGPPVVNVHVELSPGDRQRFSDQTPMTDEP